MTNEEIQKIESQKEEAELAIKKGEALKRLRDNADYQLVIQEGYLSDYPKELAEAIAKNTGAYDTDKLVTLLRGTNGLVGYQFQVGANYNAALQTLDSLKELIESEEE